MSPWRMDRWSTSSRTISSTACTWRARSSSRSARESGAFVGDVIFAELETRIGGGTLAGDINLQEWLITPRLSYRIQEDEKSVVDIQAGVRITDIDVSVTASLLGTPLDVSGSERFYDAHLGFKAAYQFSEQWQVRGGLSLGAGDSNFVAEAIVGLAYEARPNLDLIAGRPLSLLRFRRRRP